MKVIDEHDCEELQESIDTAHSIDHVDHADAYGPIIFRIVKTEKGWIAHNGEYASFVRHCPFCGKHLD